MPVLFFAFSGMREVRGEGVRRRVLPYTRIPSNWQSFLRVDGNKEELFCFLTEQTTSAINVEGKVLYCTFDEKVLCRPEREDLSRIQPCTQEEADSRMNLHVLDVTLRGLHKVMIRTNGTDVVVLAISLFLIVSVEELWIAFGTGKNFRYIAVHEIATEVGQSRSHYFMP